MSDRTEYIDKQDAIYAVHRAAYQFFCGSEDGDELSEDEKLVLSVNKAVCGEIKALPSADVQPVRHGRWIEEPNCMYRCSSCVNHYPSIKGYMDYCYCPSCGARMDGE